MFSMVLSAVFRYLPEVIGSAIAVIFLKTPYGGRFLPESVDNLFLL